MISMSSVVIAAWRARLNLSVSDSIISEAFLEALSIADIRADCSEAAFSIIAPKTTEAVAHSRRLARASCLSSGSNSYSLRFSGVPSSSSVGSSPLGAKAGR